MFSMLTTQAASRTSLARRDTHTSHPWFVHGLLALFIASCVFDPADIVLSAKIPLFLLLMVFGVGGFVNQPRFPVGQLIYVSAFTAIPLLSLLWYFVIDGREPNGGFILVRTYFLIAVSLVLTSRRIDVLPTFSAILTLLAASELAIYVAIQLRPALHDPIHFAAEASGVAYIYRRNYDSENSFLRIYFATSPLLVVPVAWYFFRAKGQQVVSRLANILLLALSIVGLWISGTRVNQITAIALPFALWPIFTRRPFRNYGIALALLATISLPFLPKIFALLSAEEHGNSLKLGMMKDYADLFQDTTTLWFGQGLGAFYYWTPKFESNFVAELTYLEIFRNFGIVGGVVMIWLLLYPAIVALRSGQARSRSLAVAYLIYLIGCVGNPNLFTSSGILLLSVLLAEAIGFHDDKTVVP